ncbi:ankyrin repeat domain-containing protein [Aliifodinibius salicampi]|uniref:Ankyrin repeat domain-containing protein n=1 Tax=Fodinibius salicampi TaxID=1920655 RepID=A0ABT3PVP0_9BACT|nr:ankyrin repeat domain-containing protein [Fodinibius salicampi]MCW9711920.1 ankyrin repeat domain-containing protein [Fodinibius salicampi]
MNLVILGAFFVVSFTIGCSSSDQEPPSENSADRASASRGMSIEQEVSPELLRQAAFNGEEELVKMGIKQNTPLDEADGMGRTALMLAAFNGHSTVVEKLLDEGADIKNRDSQGRTPLIFAASGPYPETVELLLEEKADPNAVDNEEGWSSLMFAAAEGNVEVVEILLDYGADVSLKDKDGETAIEFAINNNHKEVVKLLEGN